LSAALVVGGPSAYAQDKAIATMLRAGGLVIVLRHGATFPDQADTDPFNFDNIAAKWLQACRPRPNGKLAAHCGSSEISYRG
jgi:hypothetical protein